MVLPEQFRFLNPTDETDYRVFPDEMESDPLIFFHCTAAPNLRPIVAEGFRPVKALASISFARTGSLGFSGRIRVAVPRMGIGERSVTSLALVIHELATNSLKYGALSAETGTLDLSGSLIEDNVELVWTERGGPHVEPPDRVNGFGSLLLNNSVSGPLGGSIMYDWSGGGVIITLRLIGKRLAT